MNRIVKFRGKRLDNGEWVYGDLLQTNEGSVCIGIHGQYIDDGMHFNDFYDETPYIDEDTLGQFTGLLDKNGKEIYEGDIVVLYSNYRGKKKRKTPKAMQGVVVWSLCGLRIKIKDYPEDSWNHKLIQQPQQIEVIGNIHDSPELLNEK